MKKSELIDILTEVEMKNVEEDISRAKGFIAYFFKTKRKEYLENEVDQLKNETKERLKEEGFFPDEE